MDRVRRVVHAEDVGYTGKGINVAVLDTGIAGHRDFSGRILQFKDFVENQKNPYDDSGHGTHVAGCLGGDGKMSRGKFRGIAPECGIIAGKVLDRVGEGSASRMIDGIEWILSIRKDYDIRILNISVGIGEIREKQEEKKLLDWLERAWKEGIFVVVAAGDREIIGIVYLTKRR